MSPFLKHSCTSVCFCFAISKFPHVRIRDLEKAEGVKPFALRRFLDDVESLSIIKMTCQILYGMIFFASMSLYSFRLCLLQISKVPGTSDVVDVS